MDVRIIRRSVVALVSLVLFACQSGEKETGPHVKDARSLTPAVEYAITEQPYTTLQRTWRPKLPAESVLADIESYALTITEIERFESVGLGVAEAPGEPWILRRDLAPGFTTEAIDPGARRSLLYFWQSADPQLIDEESPIRLEGVYDLQLERLIGGSTYRPQGHLITQVFEAHVRTARALSELSGRRFDFAIVTGDLTDTGQENEYDWLITTLNGGVIDPDSGANDDPIPGPGNDFNDPFTSPGIGAPWYAVLGNHETLYIGSAAMTDEIRAAAVGDRVYSEGIASYGLGEPLAGVAVGYRDGSAPNAPPVTSGVVVPDAARRILNLEEALAKLREAAGEPAGHGLDAGDEASSRGDFSVRPVPERPVRLIGLNTINRGSPKLDMSQGWLTADQLGWLREQLDAALTADEVVIVASHHRSGDFDDSSPVAGQELRRTLSGYPNVVLHVVGHGHRNCAVRVDAAAPMAPRGECADSAATPVASLGGGYWELMLASTVDFPMHSRVIELVYEGDGVLSIYTTNVDHNSAPGTPGFEARALAAARRIFQDGAEAIDEWERESAARNLRLITTLPAGVAAAIESAAGLPARIESEASLAALEP